MDENMQDDRMVDLVSSDNITFSVSRIAISQSVIVDEMLQNLGYDQEGARQQEAIPLPNVTSNILQKVIEYCEEHRNDPKPLKHERHRVISDWDRAFLNVDRNTLFALTHAADYLHIKNLLRACAKSIADLIKGKSVEEIREIYKITNDYPQEIPIPH